MPIDASPLNFLCSWGSMLNHLLQRLDFGDILVALEAEHSPLHGAGLSAAYKARVLHFLLCNVAPRHVSPCAATM